MKKITSPVIREGIIDLGFMKVRCYTTEGGERYLNADDIEELFMGDHGDKFTEETGMKLAEGIKLGKFDSENS